MTSIRSRSTGNIAVLLVAALALSMVSLIATAGTSRATRVSGLQAQLTAEAEVPVSGPEGATGSARIRIDLYGETENPLCFELTVAGLAETDFVTAAHIHAGAAGVSGDVVVPLFTEPPAGELSGCLLAADLELLALIATHPADYYVNIHTDAYPAGFVRGQLDFTGTPTGPGCTFVAALGLTAGGEGSSSLTVAVGQDLVFWGYLIPLQTVDFTYVFNGQPFGDFTPSTADEEGYVLFVSSFRAGQEGVWTVTASVAGTECAATVELTVTPASAPTGTPPLLPDTAFAPPVPEPLGGLPFAATLAILLSSCLMLAWRSRTLGSKILED
ncbi:MAG: CHRD domain-containing protein [Chloroflexota bacterium]|nr:CHRD domain-containing protein [Chloroflexota bacterium]